MKTQQTTISEVSHICRSKVKASDKSQVKCSRDAYNLFMEQWDHDTIEHAEEFKLILQEL
jgi:DNA repair protein RadC